MKIQDIQPKEISFSNKEMWQMSNHNISKKWQITFPLIFVVLTIDLFFNILSFLGNAQHPLFALLFLLINLRIIVLYITALNRKRINNKSITRFNQDNIEINAEEITYKYPYSGLTHFRDGKYVFSLFRNKHSINLPKRLLTEDELLALRDFSQKNLTEIKKISFLKQVAIYLVAMIWFPILNFIAVVIYGLFLLLTSMPS